MATYRVGAAGATVFNASGKAVARLRPGYVVVEDLIENEGSLAAQHAAGAKRRRPEGKRQKGYADKKLRPVEDKAR